MKTAKRSDTERGADLLPCPCLDGSTSTATLWSRHKGQIDCVSLPLKKKVDTWATLWILSTELTKVSFVVWTLELLAWAAAPWIYALRHTYANNLMFAIWIWLSAESTWSQRHWIFWNQNSTVWASSLLIRTLTLAKFLYNHCWKYQHHHDLNLFQR